MTEKATLAINRRSAFNSKLRKFSILKDGTKLGEVGDGETAEFEISPGVHQIVLTLDWCKSQVVSFEASAGERVTLEASSTWHGYWILCTCLLAPYFYVPEAFKLVACITGALIGFVLMSVLRGVWVTLKVSEGKVVKP